VSFFIYRANFQWVLQNHPPGVALFSTKKVSVLVKYNKLTFDIKVKWCATENCCNRSKSEPFKSFVIDVG